MSHLKERKEKNCLNCNAQLQGKYCHICGQENTEPKESIWYLVNHFFQDVTHFDGKFFSTLKYIITRPGFLTREYMKGRRASYLNPVRMYIFTSAFFFLVFFSFLNSGRSAVIQAANDKNDSIKNGKDSVMQKPVQNAYPDFSANDSNDNGSFNLSTDYSSGKEYDSLLHSGAKDHNWLTRQFLHKQIDLNERFKGRGNDMAKAIKETFLHKLPQMLFVSLPLLALLLKLLYVRRKEFYYVSHFIFSIDLYIFIFMSIIFTSLLGKISAHFKWGFIDIIKWLIIGGIFFYVYKAMHNFYGQGRTKTILKFLILNGLFLIIMVFLFIFFIAFSFFSI